MSGEEQGAVRCAQGSAPETVWDQFIDAIPTVLYWYFRVSGLVSILAWFWIRPINWMAGHWTTRWVNLLGVHVSLPYGLLLLLLSIGIRRRKKAAWRITVLVLAGYFALACLVIENGNHNTGDWTQAFIYGSGLALLSLARDRFSALPDRANRRLAMWVFGALFVVNGVIGMWLVSITDRKHGESWAGRIFYVMLQAVAGPGPARRWTGIHVPYWVVGILGVLGAALLVVTVWALFRPARADSVLTPEEELPARALLARYGDQDSLGYFALRRDKDVIVAPNGRAAVAYRAEGSVCLASGDPLGDPESWDAAIEAWLAECKAHAWIPGVMSAGERGATAYGRHGMDALELGDEAILELGDFSLDGREMRQVRQAVSRVDRAGYTIQIRRHAAIPPEEMAELVESADRWRDGETERGFSMALGRLGDPTDGHCVMVEAFDRDGTRRGLLSFVPWGRAGLSLDLMRRDRDAENGLNEFMVAKLAENAAIVGVNRLSLNFAVLRSVFERGSAIGAGPITRLVYGVLSLASKFWQLESLYLSNAKYQPIWVPRYVCFAQNRDTLRIGLAAARAEGFLPTFIKPKPAALPAQELVERIKQVEEEAEAARIPRRRLSEQERVRHAKLGRLSDAGMEAYPLGYDRTDYAADIRTRFGARPADTATGCTVSIAGRVMLAREHGKLIFATLRDETGDLQVMLASDVVGAGALRDWKTLIDLGDQVGVAGEVVTSRSGELSVLASSWTLTSKCLRPLPNKRTGLSDPEMRIRQRYVDLIVNDGARKMIRMRGDAVAAVRDGLRERDYLEVETPMLQPVHGGATARPFTTRMNAYNMQLFLRIAPELYLKRLVTGGVGKVFELNRNFRNEGVSPRHNPEFTMLEAYEPYGNYDTMANLTRGLVLAAAQAALGGTVVVRDGVEYDLAEPWHSITVYEAVSEAVDDKITPDTELPVVQARAAAIGMEFDPDWSQGKLVQELFEFAVEHKLRFPTFVRDYPAETSPLTRPHRADCRLAEKWDLIVFGIELGTAYSELIDPVLQRQRLTEQSLLAAGGDPEAMKIDEDFLRALEYAMPPSGGMGMGIDRLMMTLTGQNIRETIPFPLVRPR